MNNVYVCIISVSDASRRKAFKVAVSLGRVGGCHQNASPTGSSFPQPPNFGWFVWSSDLCIATLTNHTDAVALMDPRACTLVWVAQYLAKPTRKPECEGIGMAFCTSALDLLIPHLNV